MKTQRIMRNRRKENELESNTLHSEFFKMSIGTIAHRKLKEICFYVDALK